MFLFLFFKTEMWKSRESAEDPAEAEVEGGRGTELFHREEVRAEARRQEGGGRSIRPAALVSSSPSTLG